MILYRLMVDGDVPAGLELCRKAGWNQTVDDWQLFLKMSPEGCTVAVDDLGKVRGTVATVRYEDRFSWIGMVLVDPDRQRQGIGIQLLRESLHTLREEDTIKLDATPAGRHIYRQLDFADEYPIARLECSRVNLSPLHGNGERPVLAHDLSPILETDREVFGADRTQVLTALLGRCPEFAFLSENGQDPAGYCFGRRGHLFSHIGPVIANDREVAKRLVSAALAHCGDNSVIIDAPVHDEEWIRWLQSLGFSEQRSLVRMFRGSNAYPGVPARQFAILGPEFG